MAEKKPETKRKEVRLVWGSPEGLPIYANQLQVSHAGGNEFHIYFGYSAPPLTHGLSEDEIDALPNELTIKTLTNIVVTPDMMKAIVRVLSNNLEKYEELKMRED